MALTYLLKNMAMIKRFIMRLMNPMMIHMIQVTPGSIKKINMRLEEWSMRPQKMVMNSLKPLFLRFDFVG